MKVDKEKHVIYFQRAVDCIKSIESLQIIYYDNNTPSQLKECRISHFDVLYMLYSIAYISLVNCMTIKFFGEKAKDHKDLSKFRKLKELLPEITNHENEIHEINNIKNKSEYGDTHFRKIDLLNLKKLNRFKIFVEEQL